MDDNGNSVPRLEFILLARFPEIVQGTFLRALDVSEPKSSDQIKNSLNLSCLIQSKQCHGSDIYIVEDPTLIPEPCDAFITKLSDVGLLIRHADCQAALFYDPVQKVIAAVHAGWRGSVAKIYTKTVKTLMAKFGCLPENIFAAISPSLGPEHAEFIHYKAELPAAFWPYQVKPNFFDFWAITHDELTQAGLLPEHIEIARQCTYANLHDFFSYRRDKTTGRHATVIGLK